MTITWQRMAVALFVAFVLHGSIALWLTLPAPEPQPEPPKQTLRVSLQATIAETTTIAEPVTPPPQKKTKSPVTLKPKPRLEPKPVPKPVIEPIPQPERQPVEPPPEIVETHAPIIISEPAPIEPTPAPLSTTATAKYEQLLVAWLEKYKKYPRRAKRMRIEGEGRLRIIINSKGSVQNVTLEQTTGNRLLDKAALQMAHRADPFPPMPENHLRQELEFIVPVVFALR